MDESDGQNVVEARALSLLPRGLFVLTSQHDGERSGARVTSVCQAATEPLLLCVAARKGHRLEPLIRDSHHFAVNLVAPTERLILRKFPQDAPGDDVGDPFDSMAVRTLSSGSPVIERSLAAFDCEVVRHFDMEADHELYVGQLLETWLSPEAEALLDEAVLDATGSGEG
ncbi:MAG: flavin reductase family protein [Planctomycetota bacterium]